MSISFKRFSYLSERAHQLGKLYDDLASAIELKDAKRVDELRVKIIFEGQFYAAYIHSLLMEVHIDKASSRDI